MVNRLGMETQIAAGSFQLRDYPTELVRLSCEKCGTCSVALAPVEFLNN